MALSNGMKITYPDMNQIVRETIINEAFKDQSNSSSSSSSSSNKPRIMELSRNPINSAGSNQKYQNLLKDKTKSSQSTIQRTVNNMLIGSKENLIFDGQKWQRLNNTAGCPYGQVIYEGRVERDHIPQCNRDPNDICTCPAKEGVKNYGSYFFVNRLYQKSITSVTENKTDDSVQQGKTYVLISIFVNKMHDLPNYRIRSHPNLNETNVKDIDFSTISMDEIEPIEDMSHENGFFPWFVIDIPKIATDRPGFVPATPQMTESDYKQKARQHMDDLIKKYRMKRKNNTGDKNTIDESSNHETPTPYETMPCMIDIYTFNVLRQLNWEPLILARDINFDNDYNTVAGVFFNPNNYPISEDQDYIDLNQSFNNVCENIMVSYSKKIRQYSESVIKLTDNLEKVTRLGEFNRNISKDVLSQEDTEIHNKLIDTIDPLLEPLINQAKTDNRIYQNLNILKNIKLYQDKLKKYNKEMKKGCSNNRLEYLKKEFNKTLARLESECKELNANIEYFKMNFNDGKYEKTMSDFVSKVFQGSDNMSQQIMKEILAEEGVTKVEIVPNEEFESRNNTLSSSLSNDV